MNNNECKFCSEHEAGDTLYKCNGWDGGVSYDYIQDIKYCPLCGRKLGGSESLPSENQNGDTINRQVAIDLLSMIEFDHAVCRLNIWYKGIDDDMKEALEMAIKALKQQSSRDIEEIEEVMNCDADAETKCKMISNILNAKPYYFKEQEPCEDAISRQATIDAIENEQKKIMRSDWAIDQAKFSAMSEIRELIVELPPVSTEKIGRWIDTGSGQECSNCHEIQCGYDNHRLYCANCGSRNEVVKE